MFLVKHKFVREHFVGTVFVGTVLVEAPLIMSLISLHITTESPIILSAYLPFSQLHAPGFQNDFFRTHEVF